jgi:hypothetical protein
MTFGLKHPGLKHFWEPVLWLGYVLLIAVPWLVARAG